MVRISQLILIPVAVIFCILTTLLGRAIVLMWLEHGFDRTLRSPLGYTWFQLDSVSLNLTQSLVQRYLLPEIWSPGITTILQQPLLGIFLISLAVSACALASSILRRKRRTHTHPLSMR